MILCGTEAYTPHLSMRSLYQAADSLEARLLIDELALDRIEAVVLGEYLTGAAGELSALNFPTVWVVDEAQYGPALRVLERFLAERGGTATGAGGAWHCARCGAEVDAGFDLCWNCGAQRSGR
jgi:hypothetical protein